MQLKMWVLTGAAITLWLVPLTSLDRRISWHKSIQGISLVSAIACAVGAGNIAKRLAEEAEIEEWKSRAIKADVADEIAVSTYVSQQSRQQEAEAILNPVQHLERALALSCEDEPEDERSESERSNQLAKIDPELVKNERAERVLELKAKGWGKAKTILEVWGIAKGGSQKYKDAEAEYHRIVEGGSEGDRTMHIKRRALENSIGLSAILAATFWQSNYGVAASPSRSCKWFRAHL